MGKLHLGRVKVRFRPLCVASTITAAILAMHGAEAIAGKPSSNTLPPVTIVVDGEAFEYRPDLGGVYDTRRGIVWGYSFVQVTNTTTNQNYAKNQIVPQYANILDSAGDNALARGDLDAAAAFYDAADAAASFTNWRLPTLTEARDAVSRGLFTYGATGLNMWTGSPADTVFGLPYNGIPTWTSDTGKLRGSAAGWVFGPHDGGAFLTSATSSVDAIMVRSYTGP
jgi:hypothetical protein